MPGSNVQVASVAAWLDSMPAWPQISLGSMQAVCLPQSGPGSAAGGDASQETQVGFPPQQDVGSADRQGTMYQVLTLPELSLGTALHRCKRRLLYYGCPSSACVHVVGAGHILSFWS